VKQEPKGGSIVQIACAGGATRASAAVEYDITAVDLETGIHCLAALIQDLVDHSWTMSEWPDDVTHARRYAAQWSLNSRIGRLAVIGNRHFTNICFTQFSAKSGLTAIV